MNRPISRFRKLAPSQSPLTGEDGVMAETVAGASWYAAQDTHEEDLRADAAADAAQDSDLITEQAYTDEDARANEANQQALREDGQAAVELAIENARQSAELDRYKAEFESRGRHYAQPDEDYNRERDEWARWQVARDAATANAETDEYDYHQGDDVTDDDVDIHSA